MSLMSHARAAASTMPCFNRLLLRSGPTVMLGVAAFASNQFGDLSTAHTMQRCNCFHGFMTSELQATGRDSEKLWHAASATISRIPHSVSFAALQDCCRQTNHGVENQQNRSACPEF